MQLSPVAYRETDLQGKPPEVIVRTMISTDDVDDYAVALPDELWPYDGMIGYQVATDDIENTSDPVLTQSLGRVLANSGHANDYRLVGETIMMSISPATARAIVERFRAYTGRLVHDDDEVTEQDVRAYFAQWIALLTWAADQRLGLVLHAG